MKYFGIRGNTCGMGHPVRHPFKRTLWINVWDKQIQLSIGLVPQNVMHTPICGRCYGL